VVCTIVHAVCRGDTWVLGDNVRRGQLCVELGGAEGVRWVAANLLVKGSGEVDDAYVGRSHFLTST
jgi:hypothetical protein